MRNRNRFVVGLAIAILATCSANSISAQDACTGLLKFGIYDQYSSASTSTQFRLVTAWMCDTRFTSYKAVSDAGGAMGIDVGVILGLSANSSSDVQEMRWHQFCSSSYDQSRNDATLMLSVRSISPTLMSALNHCLEIQQTGFMTWITTSADRKTFSYFARYRPNGDEKAKINSFSITPLAVENDCKAQHPQMFRAFKAGEKIGNAPVPLTCTVAPETTVTVTLAADKSGPDGNSFVRTLDGFAPGPLRVDEQYSVDAAGYSTARQWLSTGLVLPSGTRLKITATGNACLASTNPQSCSGPTGVPNANPACAALGIVCGALYGKIGADGSVFFVGASYLGTVPTAGALFLGYGDINYLDNSGGFTAHVVADVPPAAKTLHASRLLNVNTAEPSR